MLADALSQVGCQCAGDDQAGWDFIALEAGQGRLQGGTVGRGLGDEPVLQQPGRMHQLEGQCGQSCCSSCRCRPTAACTSSTAGRWEHDHLRCHASYCQMISHKHTHTPQQGGSTTCRWQHDHLHCHALYWQMISLTHTHTHTAAGGSTSIQIAFAILGTSGSHWGRH